MVLRKSQQAACIELEKSECLAGRLHWTRRFSFFITPNYYIEVDRSESEALYLLWILDKEKAKEIWILALPLFDWRVSAVSQGESAVGH